MSTVTPRQILLGELTSLCQTPYQNFIGFTFKDRERKKEKKARTTGIKEERKKEEEERRGRCSPIHISVYATAANSPINVQNISLYTC